MFDQLVIFSSIATGLLGLFVIAVMISSYKSNKLVNIHLVIIFFFISFRFLTQGLFDILSPNTYDLSIINPIYLITIPIFYLYFKSLLNDYKHLHFKDLYHTIFPLAMVLLTLAKQYFLVLSNSLVSLAQFVSVIIFIIFYLGICFNVIYRDLWRRDKSALILGRHYQLIKNWVGFIFFLSTLLCFRLLTSLILEETSNLKLSGQSFSLFANVLWIIIFGKILSNPEILYGLPKLEERLSNYINEVKIDNSVWNLSTPEIKNLQDSTLKCTIDIKIKSYIVDIEFFINTAHPLRDPNFSFKEIANELNIPASHLAYVFKYHCKVPFVEFKKYSKILDALELINNGYLNTMTFEAVAEKTGFNSYNSFFVAFKKETGQSPKNFIASKKNNRLTV